MGYFVCDKNSTDAGALFRTKSFIILYIKENGKGFN